MYKNSIWAPMFVLSRSISRTPQTVLASTEVTSESGDCKSFNWASDNSVKSNYFCFSRHLRLNDNNKKKTHNKTAMKQNKKIWHSLAVWLHHAICKQPSLTVKSYIHVSSSYDKCQSSPYLLYLVKPTLNKVEVDNFQQMAVLANELLECWSFFRISLGHSPASSVLGVRSCCQCAAVGFLTVLPYGPREHVEARVFSLNAFSVVLSCSACSNKNTYGRIYSQCFHRQLQHGH